jgi:hypothetical protein
VKYEYRRYGLIFVLLLGTIPLFAQTSSHTEPEAVSNDPYVPESGLARASSGTLQNDIDRFISVQSFRDIKDLNGFFGYLGFTPEGLNLGYSRNIGSNYIAVGYSGSLIEDLFQRLTNGNPADISTSTTEGSETSHRIQDSNNNPLGNAESRNQLGILFGTRVWAFKIDFSHTLNGKQSSVTSTNQEGEFASYQPGGDIIVDPSWRSPIP